MHPQIYSKINLTKVNHAMDTFQYLVDKFVDLHFHFCMCVLKSYNLGTAGGLSTTNPAVEGAIHQTPSDKLTTKNMLVLSGGEGYIDFRVGRLSFRK